MLCSFSGFRYTTNRITAVESIAVNTTNVKGIFFQTARPPIPTPTRRASTTNEPSSETDITMIKAEKSAAGKNVVPGAKYLEIL